MLCPREDSRSAGFADGARKLRVYTQVITLSKKKNQDYSMDDFRPVQYLLFLFGHGPRDIGVVGKVSIQNVGINFKQMAVFFAATCLFDLTASW